MDFSDCSSGGITDKVLSHCTNSVTGTDQREAGNPRATNLGQISVKCNENHENIKVLRALKHYITVKEMRLKSTEITPDQICVYAHGFYEKICRNTNI